MLLRRERSRNEERGFFIAAIHLRDNFFLIIRLIGPERSSLQYNIALIAIRLSHSLTLAHFETAGAREPTNQPTGISAEFVSYRCSFFLLLLPSEKTHTYRVRRIYRGWGLVEVKRGCFRPALYYTCTQKLDGNKLSEQRFVPPTKYIFHFHFVDDCKMYIIW